MRRLLRAALPCGLILWAQALTGCVEHRYEIDVRYDGSEATRTVTIERVLHGGGEPDPRQDAKTSEPSDPEEIRLTGLYGQGVPAAAIGERGGPMARRVGESARQFVGRFDRTIPDDVGGSGEIVRCDSPIGSAILYHEVIRPTPNLAEHLTQAHRILDALVDATIDAFQAEYGDDRGWPSLRATVTGVVRSDLHHLLACGWAIDLANRLEPGGGKGASTTGEADDMSQRTWWRVELVQRHYVSPAQAIPLFIDEGEVLDSIPEAIALGIESKCRHLGANAAADLLARIRSDLTFTEPGADPEGETDPAAHPGAADPSHQPDWAEDPASGAEADGAAGGEAGSPSDAPSVAEALQERLTRAMDHRLHEVLPALAMPGWPPISQGSNAQEADDESPFLAAAVAMAFPGIAISMRYDSISLHATLPGSVVATNGKPDAAREAGRDGAIGWNGSVLPTPGMPGDMGLRAWLVTAVPDEQEQRRLWGRTRCEGKSLAKVAALYSSLTATEQGTFRSALAASRDRGAWDRFLQARAEGDDASSTALDQVIEALTEALDAP